MEGNYIAGWKFSEKQINFHLTYGKKLIKNKGDIVYE